ncbi:MAG: hypothetical protein HRT72_08265 [Flavobacteriales bacterium]|nr:hypothetical protein [Flavobacteriales bacterium]
MKYILAILIMSALLMGCDKNKEIKKNVDGVWNIDTKTYNETDSVITNAGVFSFYDCVQPYCTGVLLNEDNSTILFDWEITTIGSTINITSGDLNGFLVKGIYSIESLKNEKLKITYNQLGKSISFELTRTGGI